MIRELSANLFILRDLLAMIEDKRIIYIVVGFIIFCIVGAWIYDHKDEYFDHVIDSVSKPSFYRGFPGRY